MDGHRVNLANLDLNLLVPLDVLLEERSVTRAAARLGLSQPALSAALARLRRHFDDALLARVGNSYELTPLAVQLRRRTSVALNGVERVFASEAAFDPSSSERTFTVLTSDYPMAVVGPPVLDLLQRRSPGITLRLEQHTTAHIEAGADGLRGVDAMVLPHGFLFELPSADLFTDSWVCLADRANPVAGRGLTMADLAELPWVFTYHGPSAFTAAGRQLQLLGLAPQVQVVVESFLTLPFFLAGTERLALVQGLLAEPLTRDGRLVALPCPFDAVPVVEALWWHPLHTHDPEHVWLRSVFAEVCGNLSR
ncbi:LysR family transcriptional regulator [Amycolatopsis sp. H20-H5]|uniref:LysR family transcriptional regulator n=1 Tax=Amycolatopsis sp. H20-H5 TaxID=3046309 RepID=UPI002DB989AF|nr:LysR family transcriptional regulator [Amycolatopsis sp. H20-H5]MEC3975475.1 LysR family transcriptional regulator [Amycolatopsis sp. H20-H5]